MATQTLALTILAQAYANQIVTTVNRTCVALRVIPMRVGGGKNTAWVVKGTGASAAPMAEGASAGTPAHDVQVAATLNWAYYKSDGGATGPAQAAAASASSPTGNAELLASNVVDSVAEMASQINQDIFDGDPTASPVELGGLDFAIGDNTNTYAGIAKGSTAYFQSSIFNPGTATAVSLGQLRQDISRIKQACGEAPDIAFCHPDVFTEIGNAFDANRRYNQAVEFTNAGGRLVKLDASVQSVMINGCTFIEDKDATLESGNTSGRIYYINSRFVDIEIQVQKEVRGLLQAMGIVEGTMLRANDGFGELPLLCAVVAMAKTADADTFMAKTYLQMRVRSPKHCGVRRFVQIN